MARSRSPRSSPGPGGRRGRRSVRVPRSFFRELSDLVARGEALVLVTVIGISGSAPGKSGAKMVVTRERLAGTVGGGRLEDAAVSFARDLLGSHRGPETRTYDLLQDLGMSCGGSMDLLFEPMTPPPRLVIFGAGHVSESLCRMASLAGFDVTVCDEREDWLTADRFPDARKRLVTGWEEAVAEAGITPDTFVASVTPGHAIDARVLRALHAGKLKPRYLGVIGSRRKAAVLRKELVEQGIPAGSAERIRIPMGLDIGAVDPPEIAISIVAELVAELREDGGSR